MLQKYDLVMQSTITTYRGNKCKGRILLLRLGLFILFYLVMYAYL